MKVTVTKRTEVNGKVIESTISASTQDYYGVDTASASEPMPTESQVAAEMADRLYESISRGERGTIITDELGNEFTIT